MTKFLTEAEIIDDVYSGLTEIDIGILKRVQLHEMIKYHSGIGMHIRNKYLLWDKENPLTKDWVECSENNTNEFLRDGVDYHPNHPDAISCRILDEIWKRANN